MRSMKYAALGIGLAVFTVTACTQIPDPGTGANMKMSDAEQKMIGSCMSMSRDDMMKNTSCTGMMAKMNVSESDMTKMMACRRMDRDAMAKDDGCMSMMKMHSDMMKAPG